MTITEGVVSGRCEPSGRKVSKIIDIRKDVSPHSSASLQSVTLESLDKPSGQKLIPSLLLWDDRGHTRYDEIIHSAEYYPYRIENELLDARMLEITTQIQSKDVQVLVELGAGNMEKTGRLLDALAHRDTPLKYYALDMDRRKIEKSLSDLAAHAPEHSQVTLFGIVGTYEDAAHWITHDDELSRSRKAFIWLGNSIANFPPKEAGRLLSSFTVGQDTTTFAGFLIAVDGCKDEARIQEAYYNLQTLRWIKGTLSAARALLGPATTDLLHDDNWTVEGKWVPSKNRVRHWFRARTARSAYIEDRLISIQEGETMTLTSVSEKWSKEEVASICHDQGLEIGRWWSSSELDYGIYWLQLLKTVHSNGKDNA